MKLSRRGRRKVQFRLSAGEYRSLRALAGRHRLSLTVYLHELVMIGIADDRREAGLVAASDPLRSHNGLSLSRDDGRGALREHGIYLPRPGMLE